MDLMPTTRTASLDCAIARGRVVTPRGVETCDVGILDGRIAALGPRLRARERVDARGLLVVPGAIDGHTHMQAPAFGTTTRDTFESGTRAAAAGGVTTTIDFTVGSDTTTLAAQADARVREAGRCVVDFALHGEVVGWRSDRAPEIADAVGAGVASFKFYTVYSERSTPQQLQDAFGAIAAAGGVAMVHAEDADIIAAATASLSRIERTRMTSFPLSRPPESEALAVERVCSLAETTGARLHIAHVSTAGAARAIARAKSRGVRVTAETCPHYLVLDRRVYAGAAGRQWSVIPPLRSPEDRAALWTALADGTLDTVATDHCPFRTADKEQAQDVLEIPCGLPGVETLLPLVYSEGVAERGFSPAWLAEVLASRPARIFGLAPSKGSLTVGADADLALLDPRRSWIVSAQELHMQTDVSPFEGHPVRGAVVRTYVRGRPVYAEGEIVGESGWGRFIPGRLGAAD